jgi:L-lactate dehydrogenase complex protein LldE
LLFFLVAMKSTSMPHVGLFIPCYIDQIYPRVGQATLELLERHGCETSYPLDQKCCGQPMANTGCTEIAEPFAKHFLNVFESFDYVVCPSGSCVAMVRQHYHDLVHDDPRYAAVRAKTYELCEFLHDVLGIREVAGRFPYRVGLHQSCHGLRELRLGKSSELVGPAVNKAATLLKSLDGLTLSELKRPDECCGFGGTFAVAEEAVSCMMGRDRIQDHLDAGTDVLTAGDMSCLMHLWGLIARDRRPIRVMHVAEILAGYQPE